MGSGHMWRGHTEGGHMEGGGPSGGGNTEVVTWRGPTWKLVTWRGGQEGEGRTGIRSGCGGPFTSSTRSSATAGKA